MVQFLSIIFFLGFFQYLFGISKVPVFFVSSCISQSVNNAVPTALFSKYLLGIRRNNVRMILMHWY